MTEALAIRQDNLVPTTWAEMKEQAAMLVRSGLLPESIKTAEAAVAVMLKGRELGIGPMEAFEHIHVIKGKPTVAPQLQLSLIRRARLLEKMKVREEVGVCYVYMKRLGGDDYEGSFSMEDARTAGLMGNQGWKSYPKNMLRWRAVGYACDLLFSDVTGGMYRPEEFGAEVDANGVPLRQGTTSQVVDAEIVEDSPRLDLLTRLLSCGDSATLDALKAEGRDLWKTLSKEERASVSDAIKQAGDRLTPPHPTQKANAEPEWIQATPPPTLDAEMHSRIGLAMDRLGIPPIEWVAKAQEVLSLPGPVQLNELSDKQQASLVIALEAEAAGLERIEEEHADG